jgi:putative transposase
MIYVVKYRRNLIASAWKERLHLYNIGLIHEHGHRVLAFNSMPDHVHLLMRYNINETIPHLMQHLKRDTSKWINQTGFTQSRFSWQPGYAGLVVPPERIDIVCRYSQNQELHHRKQTMGEEIEFMLNKEGIKYDPRRGFQPPE